MEEFIVTDCSAEFIYGETLTINLKSPGGEIAGFTSLIPWIRAMRRRSRANRYQRVSTRYPEPFRFRVRASRGGKGK